MIRYIEVPIETYDDLQRLGWIRQDDKISDKGKRAIGKYAKKVQA